MDKLSTTSSSVQLMIYDQSRHRDGVIDVLTRSFTQHEPMSTKLQMPTALFRDFVQALLPKAQEEGLSVVGVDPADNTIVAAVINEDPALPPAEGLEAFAGPMGPIFEILETLSGRYAQRFPNMQPKQHLHIFMVGVDDNWLGKGVARRVLEHSMRNAASKGYRHAYCEATGSASQHVFQDRLGFECAHTIKYDDFRWQGTSVFRGAVGGDSSKLLLRDL